MSLLTLVIPSSQRPRLLWKLLVSIHNQTSLSACFEILVVFHKKDDPGHKTVNHFQKILPLPLRVLYSSSPGASSSRLKGLDTTQTKWAYFLDDDTEFISPDHLEKVLSKLSEWSAYSAVGGGYKNTARASSLQKIFNQDSNDWLRRSQLFDGCAGNLLGGNVLYNREQVQALGCRFDEKIRYGGSETQFHLSLLRTGGKLLFVNGIDVYHSPPLNFVSFVRKSYLQGFTFGKNLVANEEAGGKKQIPSPFPYNSFQLFLWIRKLAFELGRRRSQNQNWYDPLWMPQNIFSARKRTLPHPDAEGLHLFITAETSIEKIKFLCTKYPFRQIALPWSTSFREVFENQLNLLFPEVKWVPIFDLKTLVEDDNFLQVANRKKTSLGLCYALVTPPWENIDKKIKLLQKAGYSPFVVVQLFAKSKFEYFPLLENLANELRSFWPLSLCLDVDLDCADHNLEAQKIWELTTREPAPFCKPPKGSLVLQNKSSIESYFPITNLSVSSPQPRENFPFPLVSFIIPCRNRESSLLLVLDLLNRQSHKSFEVLIVDDGSSEPLIQSIQSLQYSFFIKVVRWERVPLQVGLAEPFRAGLCRNLGASEARAQQLCFLDSDILLGPHFVETLIDLYNPKTVFQPKRQMLKWIENLNSVNWETLSPETDFYREDSYWEHFKSMEKWTDLPAFWKYTCTYCFAIDRELFWKVGAFNPNFQKYGFEDVDLGFRLHLNKTHFEFFPTPVYHLCPDAGEQNSFHFDEAARAKALYATARLFYFLHLHPAIFDELASLIQGQVSLLSKTRQVGRQLIDPYLLVLTKISNRFFKLLSFVRK